MAYGTATVRKLTPGCGAEVLGVDLRDPSNSDMETIRAAYRDYGVIFFRDQELTPEEHISFARRWGEIDINKFFPANVRYPEIAEVRKEKEQKVNIGGGWHTDHSYDAEPAMGSILVARELPETGGDTLFADMYKAYDALSDGLKETLSAMKAVHSNEAAFGAGRILQVERPERRLQGREPRRPGGPPGRHHASLERPEGALRESRFHNAFRRLGHVSTARLCSTISMPMPPSRSSPAASNGAMDRLPSGTTARPGISP